MRVLSIGLFCLDKEHSVSLYLFDIDGSLTKIIVADRVYSKGYHELYLDDESIPSGVYVFSLYIDSIQYSSMKIIKY